MPDQHKKPQAPSRFPFTKQEFKTAIRVFKELSAYYDNNAYQVESFFDFGQDDGDDTVTDVPDFTIDSRNVSGGGLTYELTPATQGSGSQEVYVNPGDSVEFFNDTGSKVRVTFFRSRDCLVGDAATDRFDLPHWNDKPYLDLEPQEQAPARTKSFSNHSGIPTGIWIVLHALEAGDWQPKRGGGGGPDMGINNP